MNKREKEEFSNTRIDREFSDAIKHSNICIIGVPRRRREKKRDQKIFQEIIAENFANLRKETDIQTQEAESTPNKINKSRPSCNETYKI